MTAAYAPGSAGVKRSIHRLWSLLFCLLALGWAQFAKIVGESAANGLAPGDGSYLLAVVLTLFLLLLGFWGMGFAFQRQRTPLKSMGLIRRSTSLEEFAVGGAIGWGGMVACVLPVALFGGITLTFWSRPRQFGLLFVDLAVLLVAALAEEVAFRGYPFQRLVEAIGPVMATLVMSGVFGLVHTMNPDSSMASTLTTVLAGILFSVAYLRTRALWLPCGLHFAWNASMGILFGLPVSGLRTFSPVISANAHGPLWLTGDGYGPEGGLVAVAVILISIGVLIWATRDYAYEYAQPVIVPGGIPVDIDAAAARQHEEAMASPAAEAAPPKLVQILPAGPLDPGVRVAPELRELDVEREGRSE